MIMFIIGILVGCLMWYISVYYAIWDAFIRTHKTNTKQYCPLCNSKLVSEGYMLWSCPKGCFNKGKFEI